MSDPNSQMKERCDHPGLDGKFRVKAECGYCKRDARIEELEGFKAAVIREYNQQVSVIFPSIEAALEETP